MKSNLSKYVIPYLVLFFVLFFIYFPYLSKWTINGDELIVLNIAKSYYLKSFFSSFTFNGPGHYQPLIFPFFKIYQILLPSFTFIHLANLVLFTCVPFLLFICLRLLIPTILSLILAAAFSLSPIFYFHNFAINAFANTVMLLINLSLIYILFKTWKKPKSSYLYISISLFILSIFIKETFLINFYLAILITYIRFKKNRRKSLKIIFPLIVIVFIFFFLRSKSLGSNNIYYAYVISVYKLKETISLFAPWLFNYPAGWQYGVRLPIAKLYGMTIVINSIIILLINLYLLIKKPLYFLIIGAGLLITLVPYLFLSRILVFHFDQSYLIFFLGIAYSISLMYKSKIKGFSLIVIAILLIQVITVFSTLPQWVKFSFVGESNEIARNYIQVLTEAKISKYSRLCIINHHKGTWPTDDGRLANYISSKPLQIFSTSSSVIPRDCLSDKSLILKNEDKKYLNITHTLK